MRLTRFALGHLLAFSVLLAVCLSVGAVSAKKPKRSPLVGTWKAVSGVDESGKETALPHKPGDNPRMTVTLTFQPDQVFVARMVSVYDKDAPSQLPPLPKEQIDALNFDERNSGKWALDGQRLTIEITDPEAQPKIVTDIKLAGRSLTLSLPSMGTLRLERAK